ncbi:hypothetical protein LTR47_011988, partial [Exophiala xenobiotica]
YGRDDGVQMPPGSSDAIRRDVTSQTEVVTLRLQSQRVSNVPPGQLYQSRERPYLLGEGSLEPVSTRAFEGVKDVGDVVAQADALSTEGISML